MRFVDAGPGDGELPHIAVFECRTCGHKTEWLRCSEAELRGGVPCPECDIQAFTESESTSQ